MSASKRNFVNLLFILFAAAGGVSVFGDEAACAGVANFFGVEALPPETSIVVPIALVVLYSLIVGAILFSCDDEDFADHYVDSIYFMGFLYTLISLGTLFYRLHYNQIAGSGGEPVALVLYYIGISVTTSIAGILFRIIVRGFYLSRHPRKEEDINKTYQLLQSVAESFVQNSTEAFQSIQLFLDERGENAQLLEKREKEYIESMHKLGEASRGFCLRLSEAEDELLRSLERFHTTVEKQRGELEELGRVEQELTHLRERIGKETRDFPLTEIHHELEDFKTGTSELNEVVDSLVSLLERKVEKVHS